MLIGGSKMSLDAHAEVRLVAAAREAAKSSYALYSKFRVGAAVLTDDGRIFSGCNVENASYGLSNCAERTALFKAVSEGAKMIVAVAVYTPTHTAAAPCGACRQVLYEFGPDAQLLSICDTSSQPKKTVSQLLPDAFGPKNLVS